jgi:acylphosphatase
MAGSPETGESAFHARISGNVQGVGFRYAARREAKQLGLSGWVRNLSDGDVEVLAEGPIAALTEFREWLAEGPPGAFIRSVNAEKRPVSGNYSDFSIEF